MKNKNILLNVQWVKEDIKRETKKYLETSGKGNTTYQNLQNAAKAVLRGKVIAVDTYIKKKERSQINTHFIPQGLRKEQ